MRNMIEKPMENNLLSAVAKHSNSSRIDAQTIRNTSQKTAERHLRNASKSQQDRHPNHAKYDRKADGKQSFVRSCETLEQQQDWCPNHTKHKPENCRTSPKERIKKLAGSMPKPCEIRSKSRWKTIFCPQLRNTRTAAGLMPKPCETQARKLPNVT